jgi:SAM-dependent MidA family methyltransferase
MKIPATTKSFWDAGAKQLNFENISRRLTAKEAGMLPSINGSRMLVRDFIHNSLYHPTYGYFSKNAQVFSPPKPYEFNKIRNNSEFMSIYTQQYQNLKGEQIWHTPTELLQPHYGNAIARYLLEQFKLKSSPKLNIYEIGAGNGTLARNILDLMRQEESDIYKNCNYNIVEISARLAARQKSNLKSHSNAQVVNKSIFEWESLVQDDCFIIGLEVLVFNFN